MFLLLSNESWAFFVSSFCWLALFLEVWWAPYGGGPQGIALMPIGSVRHWTQDTCTGLLCLGMAFAWSTTLPNFGINQRWCCSFYLFQGLNELHSGISSILRAMNTNLTDIFYSQRVSKTTIWSLRITSPSAGRKNLCWLFCFFSLLIWEVV